MLIFGWRLHQPEPSSVSWRSILAGGRGEAVVAAISDSQEAAGQAVLLLTVLLTRRCGTGETQ